jgi:hypothetical protein
MYDGCCRSLSCLCLARYEHAQTNSTAGQYRACHDGWCLHHAIDRSLVGLPIPRTATKQPLSELVHPHHTAQVVVCERSDTIVTTAQLVFARPFLLCTADAVPMLRLLLLLDVCWMW